MILCVVLHFAHFDLILTFGLKLIEEVEKRQAFDQVDGDGVGLTDLNGP